MRPRAVTVLVLIALTLTVADRATAQAPTVRERLGGRFGAILSNKELSDNFGNGYNLELNFTERITRSWFVEIRIGALYMGDLNNQEITNMLWPGFISEMRILLATVGPQYDRLLSEHFSAYGGAGAGIYTVSMLLDSGVLAGDFSDQHFGWQAHGGIYFRLTRALHLDLNATMHFVHTGGGLTLFREVTGGGSNPMLLQLALGLSLELR